MAEPSIDPTLLEKGVQWLWTMLVLAISSLSGVVLWLWREVNARIRRNEVSIHDIRGKIPSDYERAETNRQRDNVSKLFDELKKHADRDEDMHRTIMKTMTDNHTELLREVSKKADRRGK